MSFGYPYLDEVRKYKKDLEKKLQKCIGENQLDMLKMEVKASASCKRRHILRYILLDRLPILSLNLIREHILTSIVRAITSTLKYIHIKFLLVINYFTNLPDSVVLLLLSVALIRYYTEIYSQGQIQREYFGGGKD